MVKKLLIGGGTGFIGKHLLAWSKNAYQSTVVSRMPAPKNISWTQLVDCGLPEGLHGVVNLAGQNVLDFTKRWTPGFKQNVFNSRVNTTKALATAINAANPKPNVYVLITGVGAYAPSESAEYTEDSPVSGQDYFSKLCIQWEAASKVDDSVRLVIIRSGVVLGRAGGMIQNMILPFWMGLGGPIGSGKQYLPWIHVDDLARLIMFALEDERVSGVLNGVAPHAITNGQFTKSFAKALNRPAKIPVPEMVLDIALNKERSILMTKGQKVIPKRVIDYGFKYKYDNIDAACSEFARLFP